MRIGITLIKNEWFIWIIIGSVMLVMFFILRKCMPRDNKVQHTKEKILQYKWYIYWGLFVGIICLIGLYWILAIPFPKARGIAPGTWLSFIGSTIGGVGGAIISAIFAYKIMKEEIHKKHKLDTQMKVYDQFSDISNEFIGVFEPLRYWLNASINALQLHSSSEVYDDYFNRASKAFIDFNMSSEKLASKYSQYMIVMKDYQSYLKNILTKTHDIRILTKTLLCDLASINKKVRLGIILKEELVNQNQIQKLIFQYNEVVEQLKLLNTILSKYNVEFQEDVFLVYFNERK